MSRWKSLSGVLFRVPEFEPPAHLSEEESTSLMTQSTEQSEPCGERAVSQQAPHNDEVSLRFRGLHAVFAAVAIAVSCWWSWYSNPDASLTDVMASPTAFDGQQIKISLEPVVESVGNGDFVVRSRGFRIRVLATIDPSDVGGFVYLQGRFRMAGPNETCDGIIEEPEFYVAQGRRAKIWISVVPAIWVLLLLLRHFRLDRRHWAVKPRC